MNKVLLTNIKGTSVDRNTAYSLSIDSWKRWCDKNEAECLVLDEPLFDPIEMSPIYFRHYWHRLLDLQDDEQLCLVDADTIIHPNCPNFFLETEGKFAAVHNDGDYDWIIRSIENYQYEFKEYFKKDFNIWNYINCGFMVTNKKYIDLHESLTNFYWSNRVKVQYCQRTYGVGTDQPLMNLFIRELDIPLKLLSPRYNIQDLVRKNILDDRMLYLNIPAVYHFNAIPGGKLQSDLWIQKTYSALFD